MMNELTIVTAHGDRMRHHCNTVLLSCYATLNKYDAVINLLRTVVPAEALGLLGCVA